MSKNINLSLNKAYFLLFFLPLQSAYFCRVVFLGVPAARKGAAVGLCGAYHHRPSGANVDSPLLSLTHFFNPQSLLSSMIRRIKQPFFFALFALFEAVCSLRAQHIPDAAFAAAIRSQCAACIDANDELTPAAAQLTTLNLRSSGVQNLSGIEGFTNLTTLDVGINGLSSLPNNLPNSLQSLDCAQNALTVLPALPPFLWDLYCNDNQLATLPPLPVTLQELRCENNPLTLLPALPAGMQILNCSNARLTSLPTLPLSLHTLNCEQNQLSALPNLPDLSTLNANENQLTALPILPQNLRELYVENNNIADMPNFPTGLMRCFIAHNRLTSLPALNSSPLFALDASHNQLLALPALSANVFYPSLNFSENNIVSVPDLSHISGIGTLDLSGNPITHITALPSLSINLRVERCHALNCLPILHDGVYLYTNGSGILCLPNLPLAMQQNPPTGGNLPVCVPALACASGGLVHGQVFNDANGDCLLSSGEHPVAAAFVEAIDDNSGQVYRAYTDVQGGYALFLPLQINYSLRIGRFSPLFSEQCPLITGLTTPADGSTTLQNIALSPTASAPLMQVDISAMLLRRCFSGYYWVSYSNIGTASANAPYIDIEFDPFINYVSNSAGISAQALGNNVYRFPLPTIAEGASGAFSIAVDVSCDAVLGQVHCTQATAAPALSPAALSWTGAVIAVTDSCINGDTVLFTIHNRGGNMLQPETYQIIEDNLMYRPSTAYQLGAGQSLNITIPAREDATYRLEAKQAPLFPRALGDSVAWAVNQNCSGISQGQFALQFNTSYSELWRDGDCTPNVGSYDPNDKQAQNIGVGIEHCVTSGDYFDYKIRYQNTGTDTAFYIAILDTLDASVYDLGSIEWGASSHAGLWSLMPNNVLQWRSQDIRLVDSATNEAASMGFISFRIRQKAGGNAVGTDIENRAAIYFDFNEPVITNTAQHRICADFIAPIAVQRLDKSGDFEAVLYPNPSGNGQAPTLHWLDTGTPIRVEICDALGRQIWQTQASGGTLQLPDLGRSGIFVLHLRSADGKAQHSLRWQCTD